MKRILAWLSAMMLIVTLTACGADEFTTSDHETINNEANGLSSLEYLQENIAADQTVDDMIRVFEDMCEIPLEDDSLLLEYGVYDFTGEDLFYFELVRQYQDDDDEYCQLRVSLMFLPDDENRRLNDTVWDDFLFGDFFDHVRRSDGYRYASSHPIHSMDIRLDYT